MLEILKVLIMTKVMIEMMKVKIEMMMVMIKMIKMMRKMKVMIKIRRVMTKMMKVRKLSTSHELNSENASSYFNGHVTKALNCTF